jgi:hypothetical protein
METDRVLFAGGETRDSSGVFEGAGALMKREAPRYRGVSGKKDGERVRLDDLRQVREGGGVCVWGGIKGNREKGALVELAPTNCRSPRQAGGRGDLKSWVHRMMESQCGAH